MHKLLPLLPLVLTGCYTYANSSVGDVPVGREVRVALTDSGSLRLAALVGPRASALEGRLAARADTAATLAVHQVTRFDGTSESWNGERVALPAAALRTVQRRTLSRGRTIGLAAGLVGTALLAVRAFQGSENLERGGGLGGGAGTGQ